MAAAFEFLDFRLDRHERRLERGGVLVPLEPKIFDLIDYLVQQRARMVSKAELLDVLWPNTVVTASSLTTAVGKARQILGCQRGDIIKSYYGRGYRFVAACRSLAPANPPPPSQPAPPLLARDAERSIVARAEALARTGRRQLLLLVGEEGIGKTRLVTEMVQRGSATSVSVRCPVRLSDDAITADLLLRQLAAALAAATTTLPPAAQQRLLGWARGSADLLSAEQRFRACDDVASLLRAAAACDPLTLVVEDLHHADEPTVRLLEVLARELARLPVLMIVTSRELESADSTALARLLLLPDSQRLPLRPLPEDAVRQLLVSVAEADRGSVVDLAGGNPLVAQLLARHLAAGGSLSHLQPLQPLLERRLSGIGAEVRACLALAAAAGRQFELRQLLPTSLSQTEARAAQLLSLLEQASAAQILEEIDPASRRYRFRHAWLHRLLAGLSSHRRRQREIAETVVDTL